jgi:hypothetical protein
MFTLQTEAGIKKFLLELNKVNQILKIMSKVEDIVFRDGVFYAKNESGTVLTNVSMSSIAVKGNEETLQPIPEFAFNGNELFQFMKDYRTKGCDFVKIDNNALFINCPADLNAKVPREANTLFISTNSRIKDSNRFVNRFKDTLEKKDSDYPNTISIDVEDISILDFSNSLFPLKIQIVKDGDSHILSLSKKPIADSDVVVRFMLSRKDILPFKAGDEVNITVHYATANNDVIFVVVKTFNQSIKSEVTFYFKSLNI